MMQMRTLQVLARLEDAAEAVTVDRDEGENILML